MEWGRHIAEECRRDKIARLADQLYDAQRRVFPRSAYTEVDLLRLAEELVRLGCRPGSTEEAP